MADSPFGIGVGVGQQGTGLDPLNPILPTPPNDKVRVPPKPAPPPDKAPPPEPAPIPEPQGPQHLPGASDLGRWLFALAIAALILPLVDLMKWFLRFSLGSNAGGKVADKLTPQIVGQPVTNALGNAIKDADNQIGVAMTHLSIDWTRTGQLLIRLAQAEIKLMRQLNALSGRTTDNQSLGLAAGAQARTAAHNALQAQQQVAVETKRAEAAQRNLKTATLAPIEYIHHVLEPEIEAQRERIRELEKGHVTTAKVVQHHEDLFGVEAITAATAVGLARLSANWVRCETWQDLGQKVCQSNSSRLRNLLNDLMPLIGIAELCSLIKLATATGKSSVVLDVLAAFSAGTEALLTCTGATKPTPLLIATPSVGPPIAYASLAPAGV